MRYIILTILITLGFCQNINSQIVLDSYGFRHITTTDGLSHNMINDIYKDSQGFMWFSTSWGLNRYDGYRLKTYFSSPSDSTSICSNLVRWTRDISDNKMLVKTISDYCIYDKTTDTFYKDDSFFKSLGVVDDISDVYVDSHRNIWIACNTFLYVYIVENNQLLKVTYSIVDDLSPAEIVGICEGQDELLFSMRNGVIGSIDYAVFDLNTKEVDSRLYNTKLGDGNWTPFVDSDGDYWLNNQEAFGLWRHSKKNDFWIHYDNSTDSPIQMEPFIIRRIAEDNDGIIWLATDHGGVSLVNKKNNTSKKLTCDIYDNRTLLSNSVNTVYCDNHGTTWLGYYQTGISYYNRENFKFGINKMEQVRTVNQSFEADVNQIVEDIHGNIWIGTNGSGILRIDKKTGQQKIFKHDENNPKSLPSDVIVHMIATPDGKIWIGTFLGGLTYFDGESFHNFANNNDIPYPLKATSVWSLALDESNRLWVGTLNRGIASIDFNNDNKVDVYSKELNLTLSDYISCIQPSRNGGVFAGTEKGLMHIDPLKHTCRQVDQAGLYPILHEIINVLLEDSRGILWVGTRNGLCALDPSRHTIKIFNVKNGLTNDYISALIEDLNHNIWVTTSNGLTNIVVSNNPNEGEHAYLYATYNYGTVDGLETGTYNIRALCQCSDGMIYVGRSYGMNYFNPNNIRFNREAPLVTFTGLKIFGEEVAVGEKHSNKEILDKQLFMLNEISLPHDQNMFTVEFSTLNYVLPGKTMFSYRLAEVSDQWITTNVPEATFTNLRSGHYTLLVKATNSDGISNDHEYSLSLTILPPWWLSTWAYLVYALVLAICIWLIRAQTVKRELDKYRLRELESETEKKIALDNMKLKFFTNISHELRTPLSLIITPLDNLKDDNDVPAPVRQKLNMINRNAHKLLDMINQLLDFRKIDVGGMQLNASNGDIVSFCKEIFETFEGLSERNIEFSFVSSHNAIIMKFDADKMGKVISHLMSNAIKFTPDYGQVSLNISTNSDNSRCTISVSDSGIGIPDKHKKHIFERFYQIQQPQANGITKTSGSGIGLHITREFVLLHHGDITIADNTDGIGSVFTISLPIYIDKNDEEKLVEKSTDDDTNEILADNNEKMKVLIVDDNADFRKLLYDILSDRFNVSQAQNGKEALNMIYNDMPDLILTDVMMPIMDGNELCSRIKSDVRSSHIPVIILTAKTSEEHRIEGLKTGADDYVVKPFNSQILMLRIEKLINNCRQNQEKFNRQIDPQPSEITITSLDEQLISKAIKYVEDNMSTGDLSVEEMSRHLGMSRVHLYKKMTYITGKTPIEFIRIIRLKRAAQLLADERQNVADIAYAVGFNNPKYFSKYFKEEFGVLPSVYQAKLAEDKKLKQ